MKKLFVLLFLVCISAGVWAQESPSCCQLVDMEATGQFAAFAADPEFNSEHPVPLAYVHQSETGKMISFKATDGKKAHAYELKAKQPTDKWLFVFHEWWGLNDHIKRESEKLYKDLGNVNVLAIDLYDQRVAQTREDAGKYMKMVKTERAEAIIKGALQHAGSEAEIGTIGWCFGGGWSMQAALIAQEQAEACVIYYGMPESNVDKLKTLSCPVLGLFASQDGWITPQVVDEFEKNMNRAGKEAEVESYDAQHAFANPSNPKYDSEATQDAYEKTMDFLKEELMD